MILIESRCGHHRDDVLGIVMRVIARDPECMPTTAISCVHCFKIGIWIDEVRGSRGATVTPIRKRVGQ